MRAQAPDEQSPTLPKPVTQNEHVRAYRFEVPAGQSTGVHRHQYEVITVEPGKARKPTRITAGDVKYSAAGLTHELKNNAANSTTFIEVEFLHPQGKKEGAAERRSRYCNEGGKTACVSERYFFCTQKFCVEEVLIDPGAISTQHTHSADHILIPTSNFEWKEEIVGKEPTVHQYKVGEVDYIHAGLSHRLINTGATPAHLVVIQFK